MVAVAVPLVVTAFTAVVYFIAKANGIPFWELSEDPASSLGGPYFTGFYANTMILVWQIGALPALFAGIVAWFVARWRSEAKMLLAGGAIGAVMGLDDFFMLHEQAQVLGAPGFLLPGVYFAAVVVFCWLYRRRLGWWLLLALGALGGWGASALVDNLALGLPLFFEDGTKAIGAAFWSTLLVKLAYRAMTQMVARRDADDEAQHHHGDGEDGEDGEDGGSFDDLHDEDLAAPRRPAPAPEPRRPAPAHTSFDDLATTPIPVVDAGRRGPVRRPAPGAFEDSATVVASEVRPREASSGEHRLPRSDEHRLPEPGRVNGHRLNPPPGGRRARHRSPDQE